jgi:hypothetical protein
MLPISGSSISVASAPFRSSLSPSPITCSFPDLVTADYSPPPFNSFGAEYDKDSVKDAYDLETLKILLKIRSGLEKFRVHGHMPVASEL